MSQLTQALNKVQKSRKHLSRQEVLMIILTVVVLAALAISITAMMMVARYSSTKQDNAKSISNEAVFDLNRKLNKEIEDRQDSYAHLKEAMLDDKFQIDFLNKSIKRLSAQ